MSVDVIKFGRPFGNRVLVRRIVNERRGLLILSVDAGTDGKFVRGVVVAVGSPIPNIAGIERDPGLVVGDVVMYNQYNAVRIPVLDDSRIYDSIPYSEVLHIFDDVVDIVESQDLVPRSSTTAGCV